MGTAEAAVAEEVALVSGCRNVVNDDDGGDDGAAVVSWQISMGSSRFVEVSMTAAGGCCCFFLRLSIQHLEQHPPVASEPKKPHPLLQSTGAFGCCSLLALMVNQSINVYEQI